MKERPVRGPALEVIPPRPNESFAVREFRMPRFPSPWHLHPEYELTLILSGRGMRFVGDSVQTFRPGDLVLVGGNLPHFWQSRPRRGEVAHSRVVQFRADCLGADLFGRPEMKAAADLLRRAGRGLQFGGRTRTAVTPLLRTLAGTRGPARISLFIGLLGILAADRRARLLAGPGFHASAAAAAVDDRLHRACRFVYANLGRRIRLRDAARAAALSPGAFCRFFRRATGRRFTEYVNDLRVGHACAELIESDRPIADIAFASGFGGLANFNRRFRERRGLTPREYRGLHRLAMG